MGFTAGILVLWKEKGDESLVTVAETVLGMLGLGVIPWRRHRQTRVPQQDGSGCDQEMADAWINCAEA
jgi:hypothetical protein